MSRYPTGHRIIRNDEETANILFAENMKLVPFTISKRFWRYLHDEDMHQIGYIALWKAAQSFDTTTGGAFSTYAVKSITNAIYNAEKSANLHSVDIAYSMDESKYRQKRYANDPNTTKGELMANSICDVDGDLLGEVVLDLIEEAFFDDRGAGKVERAKTLITAIARGYRSSEVADHYGLSRQAINQTLYRIRDRLAYKYPERAKRATRC